MSLTRALIAADLSVTTHDRAASFPRRGPGVYIETAQRRNMRCLLEGAGLAGAQVKAAFHRVDGSLRYMLCEPCPGADVTAKYVTVLDVELSDAASRKVYRRVNLDTIAGIEVVYKAAPAHLH